MRLLLILALVLVSHAARAACTDAGNDLIVDFVCTKIQGDNAFAPGAIFCDAVGDYDQVDENDEVISSAYTREFHTLKYEWDFGDPASGTWATNGASRNYVLGPVSGHMYETAGSYTVTLTVTNPAGACKQNTQAITIADQSSVFTDAETWCFCWDGDEASGACDDNGAGGFTGCPLDTSGNDGICDVETANCQEIQSLSTAASNCGAGDRCLWRAGDTFTGPSSTINLAASSNANPGMFGSFGSGNRPKFTWLDNTAGITIDDYWMIYNFDVDMSATTDGNSQFVNNESRNKGMVRFVLWNSSASEAWSHFFSQDAGSCGTGDADMTAPFDGSDPVYSDLVYIGKMTATGNSSSTAGNNFLHTCSDRLVIEGSSFDIQARRNSFGFRWVRAFKMSVTNSKFLNTDDWFQIRTTGSADDNQFYYIWNNHFSISADDTETGFFRTCGQNDCAGGTWSNIIDIIFDANLFTIDAYPATLGLPNGFTLETGELTFKNNILDLQGFGNGSSFTIVTLAAGSSTQRDNVHILNNTVYDDVNNGDSITACTGSIGTGGLCYNNLFVTPWSGGFTAESGTTFTAEGNLSTSTEPFVGAVPEQGLTDKDDFKLAAASAPIDHANSHDYTSDTSFSMIVDAYLGCRTDPANVDIGAHEYGSTTCAQSVGSGSGGEGIGITGGGWSSAWEWR